MTLPRIKANIAIITLDVKSFTQKLESVLRREQKRAIREWARAVVAKIPTYTGTARGTFAPLNRIVGRTVSPRVSPKNAKAQYKVQTGTTIEGQHYKLGFNAGRDYSESRFLNNITKWQQEYIFEFDQSLPYVVWNESAPAPYWMNLPSNPPWLALDAGQKAFDAYVLFRMPDVIQQTLSSAVTVVKVRKG